MAGNFNHEQMTLFMQAGPAGVSFEHLRLLGKATSIVHLDTRCVPAAAQVEGYAAEVLLLDTGNPEDVVNKRAQVQARLERERTLRIKGVRALAVVGMQGLRRAQENTEQLTHLMQLIRTEDSDALVRVRILPDENDELPMLAGTLVDNRSTLIAVNAFDTTRFPYADTNFTAVALNDGNTVVEGAMADKLAEQAYALAATALSNTDAIDVIRLMMG